MHTILHVRGPLSHLSSTLPFAPLICCCYISILHLFLRQAGERWGGKLSDYRLKEPIPCTVSLTTSSPSPLLCGNPFLPPLHIQLLFSPSLRLSYLLPLSPIVVSLPLIPLIIPLFHAKLLFLHPLCATYANVQMVIQKKSVRKAQIRQERRFLFFSSSSGNQLYLYRRRHSWISYDTSKGASRACGVSRSGRHFVLSYLAESC